MKFDVPDYETFSIANVCHGLLIMSQHKSVYSALNKK